MNDFWIDSSVLIKAKDGNLAFDLAPGFWEILERGAKNGSVRSSSLVYDELVPTSESSRDNLSIWAIKAEGLGMFVTPDDAVINEFRPIADYVYRSCNKAEADLFLRGADPWLIAHAKLTSGLVVTEEKAVTAESKKVRIPNVCTRFRVGYIDTPELIRRSGEQLVIKKKK